MISITKSNNISVPDGPALEFVLIFETDTGECREDCNARLHMCFTMVDDNQGLNKVSIFTFFVYKLVLYLIIKLLSVVFDRSQ